MRSLRCNIFMGLFYASGDPVPFCRCYEARRQCVFNSLTCHVGQRGGRAMECHACDTAYGRMKSSDNFAKTASARRQRRPNQSLKPTPPVPMFTFSIISFLSLVCHTRLGGVAYLRLVRRMPQIAGVDIYSVRGQIIVMLLQILRVHGAMTRSGTVDCIADRGWFDVRGDDWRPYPQQPSREARWKTLLRGHGKMPRISNFYRTRAMIIGS